MHIVVTEDNETKYLPPVENMLPSLMVLKLAAVCFYQKKETINCARTGCYFLYFPAGTSLKTFYQQENSFSFYHCNDFLKKVEPLSCKYLEEITLVSLKSKIKRSYHIPSKKTTYKKITITLCSQGYIFNQYFIFMQFYFSDQFIIDK